MAKRPTKPKLAKPKLAKSKPAKPKPVEPKPAKLKSAARAKPAKSDPLGAYRQKRDFNRTAEPPADLPKKGTSKKPATAQS